MKNNKFTTFIIGGIVAVFIIWGACSLFSSPSAKALSEEKIITVQEYSEAVQRNINTALSNPNHGVRKRIESAHGTVTTTSAYVSKIQVLTKNGSNNAGKDGSNVREVNMNIMVRWDGVFHKNGYTEFYISLDTASTQVHVNEAKIVKTNALINMEDPNFWFEVGTGIGLLLL